MATVNVEETLRAGITDISAGDAVSNFTGALATFLIYELPFNGERLSDVGEIKIVVELGSCPDLADFDSPMVRGHTLNELWFLAILKPEGDIFPKAFLISFDGEMIVGMTISDYVLRDLALGQQSIGSHILALNINGVKQGDGHLDLVGAFDFFTIVYGQSPHFFWV